MLPKGNLEMLKERLVYGAEPYLTSERVMQAVAYTAMAVAEYYGAEPAEVMRLNTIVCNLEKEEV